MPRVCPTSPRARATVPLTLPHQQKTLRRDEKNKAVNGHREEQQEPELEDKPPDSTLAAREPLPSGVPRPAGGTLVAKQRCGHFASSAFACAP
eukprot:4659466-Prymnesium_polylepis.1